ncbi:hypothetical protein [Endozoicomonas arenosclerae]|uniref:hypothetical protein n=1 Tax=Endozoicomonas arenosclerae TaxID=1633495 RepID=UPI000780B0C2|nr:hypothetical protein [Endozoicomonas arenosclerae]
MTVDAPQKADIELQLQVYPDASIVFKKVDAATQYIEAEEPKDRPLMNLQYEDHEIDVSEVLRVEGIPTGTTLYYPGGQVQVDDGYIEWSSIEEGSFYFRFINFPYMEAEINAIVRRA